MLAQLAAKPWGLWAALLGAGRQPAAASSELGQAVRQALAELVAALGDPHVPFLRYALVAGLLASVAFGILGSYVVVRRISYLAAAIAHCVLGGIGLAVYLRHAAGWQWLEPMYGALVAALAGAVTIGLVSLLAREREDTVIGAVWVSGMALGLLLLYRVPAVDPMSYLFGDINYLSRADLWLIAGLDALIMVLAVGFHNKLLAVCFDEQFAELRAVRSGVYYLLLLCLVGLTVVMMVWLVGIVMVVALLTLPAAAAGRVARRFWQMMALATLLCMALASGGLGASFVWGLPSGPVIVLAAAGVYLVLAVVGSLWKWRGKAA